MTVHPLKPPFDTHNLGAEADRLRQVVLTEVGWPLQYDAQVQTLRWIQDNHKLVPRGALQALQDAIGKRLGWPQARVAKCLRLETPAALHRAVRAKPRDTVRLAGEEVYPHDGWLGEYLLYTQANEVPLAWHFWVGVLLIAAAARRNYSLDRNIGYVYPNHYVLMVGRTARGKSVCASIGIEVLRLMNRLLEDSGTNPHDLVRVIPEKITPERFLHMISSKDLGFTATNLTTIVQQWSDSTALFFVDELVTLFSKEAFHSGATVQLLTALYGCPAHWVSGTIGRGEDVLRNVALNFLGGTTLEWIRSSMTDDAAHGGFLGRCIVSYRNESNRVYPLAEVLDPVVQLTLAERLAEIAKCRDVAMQVAPNCETYYADLHTEYQQRITEDDRTAGYWGRKGLHLWKLAMVLALSGGRHTVTLEDLQAADTILAAEEQHHPKFYRTLGTTYEANKADRVIQVLRANGGLIGRSELFSKCRRFVGSTRTLDEILNLLEQSEVIRVTRHPGRPMTYQLTGTDH